MVLRIDYIELQSLTLPATKAFLVEAFGWSFTDYGAAYASFAEAGVDGGIEQCDAATPGPPLVVLKADDLAAAEAQVVQAGGEIVTPAFDFPGGRRFHFREPGGNVLAVWSES